MSHPVDAAALLAERFGARLGTGVALAPMTTYRVGGPAKWFLEVDSVDDLAAIGEISASTGLPVLVIGRGSNMLVADRGFAGLAVRLGPFVDRIDIPDTARPGTPVTVGAGGAVALPVLARRTAAAGLEGFEWAVGIPGSIGGAVRMNAGGHGSDMAAVTVDVDVFDVGRPDEPVETIPADRLGLRFRASDLLGTHVVLGVRLRLTVGDRERAEERISEIVRWRREHQPGGQNCGSVFVNPVPGEVAAGAIIDRLGMRGLRLGTAEVSPKHANFIQADEGGSADDVRELIEVVRRRVRDATGYHLRTEVRLVGFDDVDPMSFDEPGATPDGVPA